MSNASLAAKDCCSQVAAVAFVGPPVTVKDVKLWFDVGGPVV